MKQRLKKSATRLLSLLVTFLVAIGGFQIVKEQGWLSPFGIDSESRDSQVVQAIERTEEISFLSLGIQGIKNEDRCAEAFGKCIPGSGETLFLQYEFTAKLGVNGAEVQVSETEKSTYVISVPEFISIGFEQPTFEVAVEDGGVLSWVTPDIDTANMVNEILNDDAEQSYIESYDQLLRDQTEFFYDGIISSIDPNAVTTYEFES